jgi:DNA-binding transcriptional LysR family regulator
MTFRQMLIFKATSDHLNITKAASRVGVSQPTASKLLKMLEEELGVKLHARVGQGIKITPEGNLLLQSVRSILSELENVQKTFGSAIGTRKAAFLLVGATESPSAQLVPRVMQSFKKTHPEVVAVLRVGSPKAVEKMLRDSDVDVALSTNPSPDPQIAIETIRNEELLAVAAAGSALAKRGSLDLREIEKVPVIAKLGGSITSELQQRGLKLNLIMHCDSVEGLKAAVKAGIGIAFLYREVIQSELKHGDLKVVRVPELKEISIRSCMMYRRDISLSQGASDFIELLRAWPDSSAGRRQPTRRSFHSSESEH